MRHLPAVARGKFTRCRTKLPRRETQVVYFAFLRCSALILAQRTLAFAEIRARTDAGMALFKGEAQMVDHRLIASGTKAGPPDQVRRRGSQLRCLPRIPGP